MARLASGERLERETGIEPATSSLGSSRSTAELLPLAVVATRTSYIGQEGWTCCRRSTRSEAPAGFTAAWRLRGVRLHRDQLPVAPAYPHRQRGVRWKSFADSACLTVYFSTVIG